MRICLTAFGNVPPDPRAMSLARTLELVGHDVSIVCGGINHAGDGDGVVRVPARVPQGRGKIGWALRRLQSPRLRRRLFADRLAAAVIDCRPDLIYAVTPEAVAVAEHAAARCGAAVVRDPRFPDAGDRDIVRLAPDGVDLSSSPAGSGSTNHTPSDAREAWIPLPQRHAGMLAIVAYRETETTPGRYLRHAMERAGVDVRHIGDRLDWGTVDAETAFVLFVESPYPAIDVVGDNPGIPVLLWAHHGEHHTAAHLRLIRRHGVHAVLLAHSWHLAHRYPVRVHRFPFAVAPELLDGSRPWDERQYDVAFVGSLGSEIGPYSARRRLLAGIREGLPAERVRFADHASPGEMSQIYAGSKTVVDDGGTRHYPITMRVFETIGSGALLLTTDPPGLSCLFRPGEHYSILDDNDPAGQIRKLARTSTRSAEIAGAALKHAEGKHLYDHRVDELVDIAAHTVPVLAPGWEPPDRRSLVAEAIDKHVEIETVAAFGMPHVAAELPLRSVWVDPRPGERSYDAVVIGPEANVRVDEAVADAVRYVVVDATPGQVSEVERLLAERMGKEPTKRGVRVAVYDLDTPGYRVGSTEESS